MIIVIKTRDYFYYENILVCIINDGGHINNFKLITDQDMAPIFFLPAHFFNNSANRRHIFRHTAQEDVVVVGTGDL